MFIIVQRRSNKLIVKNKRKKFKKDLIKVPLFIKYMSMKMLFWVENHTNLKEVIYQNQNRAEVKKKCYSLMYSL